MNMRTFGQEVSAWLDPFLILEAGIRYDKEPQNALVPVSLGITSPILSSAREGALYDIVSEFLENFRVPPTILEVLRTMTTVELSKNAWKWLENISFEGSIELVGKKDPRYPKDTIFLIHERDAIADILTQPVQLLVNLVGQLADTWKQMAEHQINSFLRHSSPGSLGVYIESRVAQSYGFTDVVKAGVRARAQNIRYRAITIIGRPPFDQKYLDVAKKMAHFNASQTREHRVVDVDRIE